MSNQSITFFDSQFQKQVAAGDYALNPFEVSALPYVHGRVLDLGCGLGNLAIAASRRGASVVAVDASEAGIARIRAAASAEKLAIDAVLADAATYPISGTFDTVVAIGLFMFFKRDTALAMLANVQEHVAAGGVAIVNVLIEGTTYLGMFEPGNYCLFGRNELDERFKSWTVLLARHDRFDAPGNTTKEFATLIARRN